MRTEREADGKSRTVVMVLPAGGMCGAAMIPADAEDPVVAAETLPAADSEPDKEKPDKETGQAGAG